MPGVARFQKNSVARGRQEACGGGTNQPGNDTSSKPAQPPPPHGASSMQANQSVVFGDGYDTVGGNDYPMQEYDDFAAGHNDFGDGNYDTAFDAFADGGYDTTIANNSFYDQSSMAGSPTKTSGGASGGEMPFQNYQRHEDNATMDDVGGGASSKQQGHPSSFDGIGDFQEPEYASIGTSAKANNMVDEQPGPTRPSSGRPPSGGALDLLAEPTSKHRRNQDMRPKPAPTAHKPSGGGPPTQVAQLRMSIRAGQGNPCLGGVPNNNNHNQGWHNAQILPPARDLSLEDGQRGSGVIQQRRNMGHPSQGKHSHRDDMGRSAASGPRTTDSTKASTMDPSAVCPFPVDTTNRGLDLNSFPNDYQAAMDYDKEMTMHPEFRGRKPAPGQGPKQTTTQERRAIDSDLDEAQHPRSISMQDYRGQGSEYGGRIEMDFDDDSSSRFNPRRVSTEDYHDEGSKMGYDQDSMQYETSGNEYGYDTEMGATEGHNDVLPSEGIWANKTFDQLKEIFLELNEETRDLQQQLSNELLGTNVELAYVHAQLLEEQAVEVHDLLDGARELDDLGDDAVFRFQQKYEEYAEIKKKEQEEESRRRRKQMRQVEFGSGDNVKNEREKESHPMEELQDDPEVVDGSEDKSHQDEKGDDVEMDIEDTVEIDKEGTVNKSTVNAAQVLVEDMTLDLQESKTVDDNQSSAIQAVAEKDNGEDGKDAPILETEKDDELKVSDATILDDMAAAIAIQATTFDATEPVQVHLSEKETPATQGESDTKPGQDTEHGEAKDAGPQGEIFADDSSKVDKDVRAQESSAESM